MSETNNYRGTYRHERLPQALQRDYFQLDGRSVEDFLQQTATLATHVRYYNEQNIADGNWEPFFEDIYDYGVKKVKTQKIEDFIKKAQMPPHLALYFAFLEIFGIAQEELNRLTQRHLEFYYKNILRFERKKEEADRAYLFFEINKKETKALIPKGTLFDGGNDKNGKKRVYVSDFDIIVNKSQICQIKTLTTNLREDKSRVKDKNITSMTVQDNVLTDSTFHKAEIGFALSSPMFYLADGDRTIDIRLRNIDSSMLIEKYVDITYSSPDGWQKVKSIHTMKDGGGIAIFIPKAFPPVAAYNENAHKLNITARNPIVRFVLRNETVENISDSELQALLELKADVIDSINVEVKESKDLLLYNDYGKINGEIPFLPFGPNPIPELSCFFMGNNKIFNKYLNTDTLNFNIDWRGLPDNITNYYKSYEKGWKLLTTQQKKTYKKIDLNKFKQLSNNSFPGKRLYLNEGVWSDNHIFTNQGDDIVQPTAEYNPHTKFGYMKIVSSLNYGHNIYSTLLGKVMMNNTDKKRQEEPIPDKPYTPEIQSLSINYRLKGKFDLHEHQLFCIHPFNNIKIANTNTILFQALSYADSNLKIGLRNEKCFYFGIKDIKSAGDVSIYFDIDNQGIDHKCNEVEWSYYLGNKWNSFGDNIITRDTTAKFNKSGIISFNIPDKVICSEDAIVWLRLSMTGECFPKILNARTNCVTATFRNDSNELSHLRFGLPKDNIQKFVEHNPKIKSVKQPYPSFDGKEAETDSNLYARISERLRHKNRASSAWDYEHLVLEAFPQISFALCLAHSRLVEKDGDENIDFSPGDILLLVSPDTAIIKQNNLLCPTVPSKVIEEISEFLKKNASEHANINVGNFVYKQMTVNCVVQLRNGYTDNNFYRDKLNEDLKNFISPWINDSEKRYEKSMTYKSKNVADVYFFLENLEYIDFVVSAEIDLDNKIYTIVDKTIYKKPHEVFTSSEYHNITINNNG